jgi:ribose 5-phosphate isomerase B
MRIVVGSDHAGFGLESRVVPLLEGDGHKLLDVGEAERGVVVCGSGAGVSIAADKVAGVRAFLGTDFEGGRHGRHVDQIADIEGRSE